MIMLFCTFASKFWWFGLSLWFAGLVKDAVVPDGTGICNIVVCYSVFWMVCAGVYLCVT